MESLIVRIDKPQGQEYPVTLLRWSPDEKTLLPAGISGAIPVGLNAGVEDGYLNETQMRDRFFAAKFPDDKLIEVGKQLHNLLFKDALGEALLEPNRRVLLDIRPAQLQALPWELLWQEEEFRPHFIDPARLFARGTVDETKALPPQEWPLRLLMVIGFSEVDEQETEKLAGSQEREAILSALSLCDPDIDLEIVKQPTRAALRKCLSEFQPHILHFIGHGRKGANPYLQLATDVPDDNKWEATAIRGDTNLASLRLVVLNACRSSADAEKEILSISEAFLKNGVPAVVGMRSDVTGETAVMFSRVFYTALAQGKPVDQAMSEARLTIYQNSAPNRRNWSAPCLQMLRPAEEILQVGAGVRSEHRLLVKDVFKEIRVTVDRRKERHNAWKLMTAERQNNLLVIHGLTDVGKTHLAHIFMERCMLAGFNVRYVDLRDFVQLDPSRRDGSFLSLLRAIRDYEGPFNSPLSQPLKMEDFAAFNSRVNEITGADASDEDAYKALDEDAIKAYKQKASGKDPQVELITTFRDCLEQNQSRLPLVVVLDQLKKLPNNEFTDYLTPHFVKWCLNHPQVRLVLVLETGEYEDFKIGTLINRDAHIPISSFTKKEWVELGMEFLLRVNPGMKQELFDKARAGGLEFIYDFKGINDPWNPESLHVLKSMLKGE